jgi:hypothetical protein
MSGKLTAPEVRPDTADNGYVPDDDPRNHDQLAEAALGGDLEALRLLDKRRGYLTEPDPERVTGIFDKVTANYTRYRVTLRFVGAVVGGTPKDQKLIEGWIKAKGRITDDEADLQRLILRTMEQQGRVPDDPTEAQQFVEDAVSAVADQAHGNGFKLNAKGLYLESRQVMALLREATNSIYAGERFGKTAKGAKNYLVENLFVEELTIPLGRDKPDVVMPFTGHVSGPSGPRSTLTYYDVCWRPTISFTLRIRNETKTTEMVAGKVRKLSEDLFEDPRIDEGRLKAILEHGQFLGLGSLRSQGAGVFRVQSLVRLEPETEVKLDSVRIASEVYKNET